MKIVLTYLKWYKYNQECIERKMKKVGGSS